MHCVFVRGFQCPPALGVLRLQLLFVRPHVHPLPVLLDFSPPNLLQDLPVSNLPLQQDQLLGLLLLSLSTTAKDVRISGVAIHSA
jgi:hypothetical protein